jgi:carbonic anhydrase
MRIMPLFLGLTLLAPAWASDEHAASKPKPAKEEAAKPAKEEKAKAAKEAHGKAGKTTKVEEPEPAPNPDKPVAPPRPDPEVARQARRLRDLESRLKRIETENTRLKHELAEKVEAPPVPAGSESSGPEAALAELRAGNARFVSGARVRSLMAANDAALRQSLAKGQAPFAVIVTCSDSRLADNFIFDQELGRLFTIREAGNCPDIQGLASIEYAVEHLGSKVVVVLGHGSCGAVKAVLESGPKQLPGNLWSLQAAMAGLVQGVRHDPNESPAEHMGHLVEANALRQAQVVQERSEIVRHLCATGKLKVVPAVYDLASGKVTFLKPLEAEAPKAAAHH